MYQKELTKAVHLDKLGRSMRAGQGPENNVLAAITMLKRFLEEFEELIALCQSYLQGKWDGANYVEKVGELKGRIETTQYYFTEQTVSREYRSLFSDVNRDLSSVAFDLTHIGSVNRWNDRDVEEFQILCESIKRNLTYIEATAKTS